MENPRKSKESASVEVTMTMRKLERAPLRDAYDWGSQATGRPRQKCEYSEQHSDGRIRRTRIAFARRAGSQA
eukprot:4419076-Pyramimonas_sp.AAC.1